MTVKTERITILGTPDFNDFLKREAKREGVSLCQLVRKRCEKKPTTNEDKKAVRQPLKAQINHKDGI